MGKDPTTKAFMQQHDIADSHALQAEFTRQYVDIVKACGKRPVVWEEALCGDLPEDVLIQPWMKGDYPKTLNRYDTLNNWGFYLDFKRPAWSYYRNSTKNITVEGTPLTRNSLGSELCIWTEAVTERTLMMTLWPTSMAIAEAFWSSQTVINNISLSDLYRRMEVLSLAFEALGIKHRFICKEAMTKLAEKGNAEALHTLARVVEPTGYHYLRSRKKIPSLLLPTIFPPSFHQSDSGLFLENLPVESQEAFRFQLRVEAYLQGDRLQADQLYQDLQRWKENHETLLSTIRSTPALYQQGIETVSSKLAELAEAGMYLLELLETGKERDAQRLKNIGRLLDNSEFDVFYLGKGSEEKSFIMGFLKPDALNRHNIAIQPAIRMLYNVFV